MAVEVQLSYSVQSGIRAPVQMAAPSLSLEADRPHRAFSVFRAAPPADGGSPILGYDLRYSMDGVSGWTLVTDVSASETLDWLPVATQQFVQTRAYNAAGPGAWSSSTSVTTQPLVVPIDYALEPFILQPPVDQDGDLTADNLTRLETDTYEIQGIFERFSDRVRCIVDATDYGTTIGTDPRCEHRGVTERSATIGTSFKVDSQIVRCADGSTLVYGSSTRVTLFQNYNVGIGNPDFTVDGRCDAPGMNYILRLGWRPLQTDSTVSHNIDTGIPIDALGVHPRVPFRVDRHSDRVEFFWGNNVDGAVPDFTTGDGGTPTFSRSGTDGDYYIKFGAYFHADSADPPGTRILVDVYGTTSDRATLI